MASSMLTVGGVTFEHGGPTFDEMARSFKARWADVPRIKSAPAQQWIGPDTNTMQVQGTIYTAYGPDGSPSVGSHTLDEFETMIADGSPVPVVSGRGDNYGMWCVKSLEKTDSAVMDNGAPRKQHFTLAMTYYGEG